MNWLHSYAKSLIHPNLNLNGMKVQVHMAPFIKQMTFETTYFGEMLIQI